MLCRCNKSGKGAWLESKEKSGRNVQSGIDLGESVEIKHIRGTNNKISKWSGGTTTEIFIFPETGDYEKREFVWRLSSATVEEEETKFTSLPDFDRILMVLEGEVILSHESERISRLSQYQQDRFGGEYTTRSYGKITDFNIIYKKKADAILERLELSESKNRVVYENHLSDAYAFESEIFFCRGEFSILIINEIEYFLKNGDCIVINGRVSETKDVGLMGSGDVLHGIIRFNEEEIERIPREKASFDDFKMAAYLALTNFRGSQYIFKGCREYWQDRELQRAIGKIERFFIPFIIGTIGIVGVAVWAEALISPSAVVPAMLGWLAFDLFLLNPIIYFAVLPKPIRAHLKKRETLSGLEKKWCEEEKNRNLQAEKILKKYTITGRNKYTE
jgi:environmental stress-induced protein Ves